MQRQSELIDKHKKRPLGRGLSSNILLALSPVRFIQLCTVYIPLGNFFRRQKTIVNPYRVEKNTYKRTDLLSFRYPKLSTEILIEF